MYVLDCYLDLLLLQNLQHHLFLMFSFPEKKTRVKQTLFRSNDPAKRKVQNELRDCYNCSIKPTKKEKSVCNKIIAREKSKTFLTAFFKEPFVGDVFSNLFFFWFA
jgi:hypothetical protein